ncbi:MAG: hypothetical protein IJ019_05655 [Alphaproteobacteria bacterium]|nr:hypothetical protein [Alphaproteobacteria bacterium]
MRKYFLLSAAALTMTTSANATTDYAEVTAKATIEVAGTFDCDPLEFGTIVVKSGRTEPTVVTIDKDVAADFDKNHIVSISDAVVAYCYNASAPNGLDNLTETSVTLKGSKGSLDVTLIPYRVQGVIGGALTIPADVKADEYVGSFTVTVTY